MEPKIIRENYRIEITPMIPRSMWGQEERICRETLEPLKPHLDRTDHVAIQCDTREVCPYCGREWEVQDAESADAECPEGMPVCCGEAQDVFLAEQRASALTPETSSPTEKD